MGKKKGKKKQEAGGGEGAKKNGKALAKEQKRTRQEQKANHKKMKERKKKEALHDRGVSLDWLLVLVPRTGLNTAHTFTLGARLSVYLSGSLLPLSPSI